MVTDADLFEPSLTQDDDLSGFDAPWHPRSLVLAAFFCGAFGGGGLMAWNFKRLGQRRLVWPCMASFAALEVLLAVVVGVLIAQGTLDPDDRGDKRMARLGAQALIVLLAAAFAARQSRRFDVFQRSDGDSAPLFRWGVLAFIVGQSATVATRLVGAWAVGALDASP